MSKITEPSVLIKNPCGGTHGTNPKEEWRRGPDPEREARGGCPKGDQSPIRKESSDELPSKGGKSED